MVPPVNTYRLDACRPRDPHHLRNYVVGQDLPILSSRKPCRSTQDDRSPNPSYLFIVIRHLQRPPLFTSPPPTVDTVFPEIRIFIFILFFLIFVNLISLFITPTKCFISGLELYRPHSPTLEIPLQQPHGGDYRLFVSIKEEVHFQNTFACQNSTRAVKGIRTC